MKALMKSKWMRTVAGMMIAGVCRLGVAQVPTTQPAAAQLPAGHPDISALQQPEGSQLPPGHPKLPQMGATTQPGQQATGSIRLQVVQKTAGGPKVGADAITVQFYVQNQMLTQTQTKLGTDGALEVPGLPLDHKIMPVFRVMHDGVVFSAVGEEVSPERPTADLEMNVYESTETAPAWSVMMRHVILHDVKDAVEVTDMLAIHADGDHAWIGSADATGRRTTLVIPLPAGATNVKVADLDDGAYHMLGGNLVSSDPLKPGDNNYRLTYTIAAKDGAASFTITAPTPMQHLILMSPDDGTKVDAPGMNAMGTQKMNPNSPAMRMFMAMALKKDQSVTISVSGLADLKPEAKPPSGDADPMPGMPADAEASAATNAGQPSSMVAKVVALGGATLVLAIGAVVMLIKSPRTAAKKGK